MSIWLIIVIAIWLFLSGGMLYAYLTESESARKVSDRDWFFNTIIIVFAPVVVVLAILYGLYEYVQDVRQEGGIINYYKSKKKRKAESKARMEAYLLKEKEDKRIEKAYLNGELTRKELPRKLNAIDRFEFEEEMALAVEEYNEVREIIYVENGYNECLNRFFMSHQDLRLYHMYKFVYLPRLSDELKGDEQFLHYLCPNIDMNETEKLKMDSSYPLQFLSYPEDSDKIKQGMFFLLNSPKLVLVMES